MFTDLFFNSPEDLAVNLQKSYHWKSHHPSNV